MPPYHVRLFKLRRCCSTDIPGWRKGENSSIYSSPQPFLRILNSSMQNSLPFTIHYMFPYPRVHRMSIDLPCWWVCTINCLHPRGSDVKHLQNSLTPAVEHPSCNLLIPNPLNLRFTHIFQLQAWILFFHMKLAMILLRVLITEREIYKIRPSRLNNYGSLS